jgi:hypothetical protein
MDEYGRVSGYVEDRVERKGESNDAEHPGENIHVVRDNIVRNDLGQVVSYHEVDSRNGGDAVGNHPENDKRRDEQCGHHRAANAQFRKLHSPAF